MRLLLFDIDMTLISTGGAGIRALNRAFESVLGLTDALASVRPHGKTDPAIIREACSNQGVVSEAVTEDRILECYVQYLEGEVAASEAYQVLPGVLALLEACRSNTDIVLGLATGNVETGARIKLGRGGLNPYFRFGGFGSDSEDRSEVVRAAAHRGQEWAGVTVRPEDIWVIGDTPMDVAAGRAGGFRTMAVATGTYTITELEEAGADCAILDFQTGRNQFLRSTLIE